MVNVPQNLGGSRVRMDSVVKVAVVPRLSSNVTEYFLSLIASILANVYFAVFGCFAMTFVPRKISFGGGTLSCTMM